MGFLSMIMPAAMSTGTEHTSSRLCVRLVCSRLQTLHNTSLINIVASWPAHGNMWFLSKSMQYCKAFFQCFSGLVQVPKEGAQSKARRKQNMA